MSLILLQFSINLLGFLYSGFIQSVMFICFVNPYNVGDRVRIENELLIVKKISTYFSEFVSVPYNKPVKYRSEKNYFKSLFVEFLESFFTL
jgi:hypothetical protein